MSNGKNADLLKKKIEELGVKIKKLEKQGASETKIREFRLLKIEYEDKLYDIAT